MRTEDSLLASYPRTRADLPPRHAELYAAQYKSNREGDDAAAGLAQRMEAWMHRQVATRAGGGPALEIGAGTLNHLRYEAAVDAYDVVEPFTALFEGKPELKRVRDVYASQFDIRDKAYARIISIAVLEHLLDLPREIAKSVSLLSDGGVFQAAIPSEGGLLWWLGWRGTTGMSYYLKHRLDYGVLMRHEHVSSASEIVAVVKCFFEDVKIVRWPINATHLSFYQYIEARRPLRDAAERYLEKGRG